MIFAAWMRFLSGTGGWRFNLRESNTEPLLRLNVETITDRSFSLRRRCKSVRNLKASAADEKRNSDGKLKNLLKKHKFEIISLGFSIFCPIMHVFCQKLWSLKRETIRKVEKGIASYFESFRSLC